MGNTRTVAIRVEQLSKVFGRRRRNPLRAARRMLSAEARTTPHNIIWAVRNISLEVQAGQVYGFLGPNGAGKTTTIRMLLDLILPTHGAAYIYGQHVRHQHGVLRRVGAIVEGASFYNFLTARKNLEVLARTAQHYDPGRIDMLLAKVGLADRADQRVHGYSTGMKQRLGLAAALLTDPDLLILDEPTNGLDPGGMREIRRFIRDLVDLEGKTVFLSSHLLGEVEQVCDRVAIIHLGEIVREGAVRDLLAGQSRLRVEAMPLDRASAVLADHWPVSVNQARNGHWLTVTAAHDDVPHVVRRLVEHHIDVYQVTVERQTLEDYFLSVVGQEVEQHHG